MTKLDLWLNQAVRHLSKDSAETVRREIREHFDAELERALNEGADAQQAELIALRALGDPGLANCEYRRVLLTSSEAALLRQSNIEARMICSGSWLKWLVISAPGTLLLLSAIFLAMHNIALARGVLVLGAMMGLLFLTPFLPIYTPARGRAFRFIKWALIVGGVVLLFGREALNWSWLLVSCIFPVFWTEWKRMSIRRKLPIAQWPKQLYL
jgi:hypothetical protein